MFNCSCCGTEVTSPYFFNGGVYGYTCIKKVNPKAKKNKGKCYLVEVVKVVFDDENSTRGKAFIVLNGEKLCVTAHREYDQEKGTFSSDVEIGNYVQHDQKWYAFM